MADENQVQEGKTKKKGGKVKWIVIILAVIVIFSMFSCGSEEDSSSTATKVGTVSDTDTNAEESSGDETEEEEEAAESAGESSEEESAEETAVEETAVEEAAEENAETQEEQTVFYVGDILEDGDLRIVYMASGVYTGYSEYFEPEEGYQYIYLQFYFENIGESGDESASMYSFECYADGYSVDMYYGMDEELSATLSPGRSTTGYVSFEVPADAEEIEVEYTTNYFTSDKIVFVYQGEEDSGYVPEANTAASEDAFAVGDIVETSTLRITYVSCEEDTSYSAYFEPEDGYHYVTCSFEFENIGEDDEYVSYYEFDCYADGMDCDQAFFRDDGISATLSAGRKATGTVTFEVPDDASVVELEYETNVWTSSRIVFTCTY